MDDKSLSHPSPYETEEKEEPKGRRSMLTFISQEIVIKISSHLKTLTATVIATINRLDNCNGYKLGKRPKFILHPCLVRRRVRGSKQFPRITG